jgi:hypothetical protein
MGGKAIYIGCFLHRTDMLIVVKKLVEKTLIPLIVRASDTIKTVKDKIKTLERIPHHLRLIFDGKILADECTVSYYGLHNGSEIILVLMLRCHMYHPIGNFLKICMLIL